MYAFLRAPSSHNPPARGDSRNNRITSRYNMEDQLSSGPTHRSFVQQIQQNPRLMIDTESDSDSEEEYDEDSDDDIGDDEDDNDGDEGGDDEEDMEEVEEEKQEAPIETKESLQKLTVVALKQRLRELGLTMTGRKADLIDRLLGGEKKTEKVKEWKKSKAKAFLAKLIAEKSSLVHTMTAEEIYTSHPWFQNYPLGKFKTYLQTLQTAAEKLRSAVRDDNKEIEAELIAFPRQEMTIRGYPYWHIHPARALLEMDVKNGKTDEMKPYELWETRVEYGDFPELVFCGHVHQEKRRQREEAGWVAKRNKKAQQMHEKEVMENKESWGAQQHSREVDKLCEMWEGMGQLE